MQTMSESSGHTCLPHLEQTDWHFRSFFRSHKIHRVLLFSVVPFPIRVTFLFLVAEIGATGCASSVIPHSLFPRQIKNFLFCLMQVLSFYDLFVAKWSTHWMHWHQSYCRIRPMTIFDSCVWWSMISIFCPKCQHHVLFCCRTEWSLVYVLFDFGLSMDRWKRIDYTFL